MASSQQSGDSSVVRTDFTDDAEWQRIVAAIKAPSDIGGQECFAYVKFVDDIRYDGAEPIAIVNSLPDDYPHYFLFIIDSTTLADPETAILVVNFLPYDDDSYDTPPRERQASAIETFRAIPSAIQSIENNLSTANMEFEEFAESVDADGVFRGFPEP
jgi:hypothetical protein